jgi:hypothetical protein
VSRKWKTYGRKEVIAKCKPVSESGRAGQWKHNPALIQNIRWPGWNPNITVKNMCRIEGEGSTFLRNTNKFLLDYTALNPSRW